MPFSLRVFPVLAVLLLLFVAPVGAAEPPPVDKPAAVTIVTLGDSITKGVREGVTPQETFAHVVEQRLRAQGIDARVINVGIGGERTDQALARLDEVIAHRPRQVTVMYGTNDSYVDRGLSDSRLTLDAYRGNLKKIVSQLLLSGIEPVLMTEPRWSDDAKNGLGENPNIRLEPYMAACRDVARQCAVPLVDHFALWTKAEKNGQTLREWTTDGCHPNARGHQEMATTMLAVLLAALRSDTKTLDFQIKLQTVLEHDDGKFLWFHPRVAAIPAADDTWPPTVLMTLQKHLHRSDYYSGLNLMRTADLGKTWTPPDARAELDWVPEPGGVNVAVCDVTPGWHPQSQKVIAIGAQVRYSVAGEQLEDRPRSNQTAYAVFDPKSGEWSRWRRLEMPPDEKFNFAYSACAQFLVEPDGKLLLPFYFGPNAKQPFSVTVARCSFDGTELKYLEHGDEISLDVVRGLVEPSLVRIADRYFLTIRNDLKGYVTVGDDPLHYRPIKAWTFDDGAELGSYNTQQHWLAHGDALFLAYTRKGANNDHVFRHRAPLFIAQVDPRRLHVLRATERVLIPERGATLGNFGAAAIDARESWVTDAEGVFSDDARRRGATGAVYLARVIWTDAPNDPQTRLEPSQSPEYEWVNVTQHAAYAPRDGAGALTFKDRMWLLGGWNPRHAASVFVLGDALWMVAGNNMQNDVWKLVKRGSPATPAK